jgi:putative hemolysin
LAPKRLALSNAEPIAAALARPMRTLSRIAYPAVRVLSLSTEGVLRALGARPSAEPPITEDEVKILIEQGRQAGVFNEVEQYLVERVFRLADRRVDELMTPRPKIVWLDIADPPEDNWRKMWESGHSAFPVCENHLDNVLGLASVKKLWAQMAAACPVDLKALMLQPLFLPESSPALKALEAFKQSGMHIALVVDEYGGTQGLVTLHDVLEAIVGDLPEPGEAVEPQAVQRADGSWLVDGMLLVDDFKELFDLKALPDETSSGYQTVGGFVMAQLGRIPSAADQFEWGGLRFEVMDMDGHRVDKVLVETIPPADPADPAAPA